MVAAMVDLLDLVPDERVLEIGTGCGYHAAVTAEVVGPENVYSVEYHDSLAREAHETLDALGHGEISIRAGDGHEGWPEFAPYDAAYLTCAARELPAEVVEQVRPGGRLLAPLESVAGHAPGQHLVSASRRADGSLDRDTHGRVRFVPMQED
jgi:protein-L-isoaspartate(D-aspartate) O-methyltransferase